MVRPKQTSTGRRAPPVEKSSKSTSRSRIPNKLGPIKPALKSALKSSGGKAELATKSASVTGGVKKPPLPDFALMYAAMGLQIPVVISPLEVTYPKSGKFTCSSGGLMKDGHNFDPNVEKFLPLLEPVRTKKGTIRVNQPYIEKKVPAYWKAQCAFRNLLRTGSIPVLQERLRKNAALGMDPELLKVEKKLTEEFWRKNAAARAEIWDRCESPEQKAEADGVRFLWERFPSGGHDGAIVLKTLKQNELRTPASRLGLCHETVDAPLNADGSRSQVDRWIVIGRDRSAVIKERQKICDEAVRVSQRAQEPQDAQEMNTRKLHVAVVSKVKKNAKKKDVWDVAGSWTIRCPYIEKQWGDGSSTCSLDIQFTRSSRHGKQMWASFEFIALTGVFRFVNPSVATSNHRSTATSSSRLMHDEDDNGDEEFDGNEDRSEEYDRDDDSSDDDNSQTRQEFYLGADDNPSPSCPQWNYRWRGEETGEGEIQLDSDKELCSITFGGIGGSELTGWLMSDLTGKIKFTGFKTGPSLASSSDVDAIEGEWSDRSSRAYEEARVNRW